MKITVLSAMMLGALTSASFANDVENGQKLAEAWCSACHDVGSAPRRIQNDAPSFRTIGRTRTMTESDLTQSLLSPHPRMPDRGLSRDEAAGIAAYINSLKQR